MKIKLPFTQSALEQFRERENQIDRMGDVLAGLQKSAEGVNAEIESARAAYLANSTVENARAWEEAFRRVSPGVGGSRFNLAEAMLSGERQAVQAKQTEARRSIQYIDLVGRALAEHNEKIQAMHDNKRAALSESLKANGEINVNVDSLPALLGLSSRITRNRDAIARLAHPDFAARANAIENAVAYIREAVDYLAPAPPPPRQLQGFVPGGGLPIGHGILNATNPEPEPIGTSVPISRAPVYDNSKDVAFLESVEAQIEAQRVAALAKEAQLEAVA